MNKRKIIAEVGKCAYCSSTENLTIDHIIPTAVCTILGISNNARENLQVLCQTCNQNKSQHLKSNCPHTARLLKRYVNRWLWLRAPQLSRRKYVFRNLPVKSLTPESTHFVAMNRKQQLQEIYKKQTGYAKITPTMTYDQ